MSYMGEGFLVRLFPRSVLGRKRPDNRIEMNAGNALNATDTISLTEQAHHLDFHLRFECITHIAV